MSTQASTARHTLISRQAIALGAMWLPITAGYALLLATYTDWVPGTATAMALIATTTAGLLSIPAWWLSGQLPWPATRRLRFYGLHVLLAVVFSLCWLMLDLAASSLLFPGARVHTQVRMMSWESLLGMWLYGLVISVSYAVRAQSMIEMQRRAAAEASAAAATAQLHALRAQLNPHFLLNTLHSVSALVRESPAAADEALQRLGDLLRYAMSPGTAHVVPLADDLSFARSYLAIEQLRLGSRLAVEICVPEETLDCEVPTLTLQPLLENAIRHGIDARPDGGSVRLETALDGDVLVISVSDDGVGTLPAFVESGAGLGIRALRDRLQLNGRPFELTIDTAPEQGFAVRLRLPEQP